MKCFITECEEQATMTVNNSKVLKFCRKHFEVIEIFDKYGKGLMSDDAVTAFLELED